MSYKKYVLISPDEYQALRKQPSSDPVLDDKQLNSDEKIALYNHQLYHQTTKPFVEPRVEEKKPETKSAETQTQDEEIEDEEIFEDMPAASPPKTPRQSRKSPKVKSPKIKSSERHRRQKERKQAEAENRLFDHFYENSGIFEVDEKTREFSISGDYVENSNIDDLVVLFATPKTGVPAGINTKGQKELTEFLKSTGFPNEYIVNTECRYRERAPSQRVITPRLW